MALRIIGVRKDRDAVITHVCGQGWENTVDEIISDIRSGRYSYYVLVNGMQASVYVVNATVYHKAYLKTTADTTTRNNLDWLPPC